MGDRKRHGRDSKAAATAEAAFDAEAADGPAQVSARTLRLFTVADTAAEASEPSAPSKNPRWLQQREKELRSEAIRERMLDLVAQIDKEVAREKPALRKAWLHEKKMELRRLSFKQPEDIIAGEYYMRRARRKLREARRNQREKHGRESEEGEDDGSTSDSGSGENKDKDKEKTEQKPADEATPRKFGGATAVSRKSSERNGRSQGSHSSEDGADNNNSDQSDAGGVFNLNPTGRIARPNPRAPSLSEDNPERISKRQKSLKKMGKVFRFPLESGFKLGRKIRKQHEKRKASSAHGSSTGDGDADADGGGGEWGERVDTGPRRLERRRRSSTSEADTMRRHDTGVRVIVADDSDGEGGGSSRSSGSRTEVDKIPELQESVGKKIRDRLAIRRPRWRASRNSSDSDSEGEVDGDDCDEKVGEAGDDAGKDKKKKKKEKEKKEKEKKDEDKKESKKSKTRREDDSSQDDDEARDKQRKFKNKDKKLSKNSKQKDKEERTVSERDEEHKGGRVNSAMEFVELEDA